MWKKIILKDAMGAWLILTMCLVAGIILNEMREKPLPLNYVSPEARLNQAVQKLGEGSSFAPQAQGDVSLDEMQKISANHAALILDARPEIFYRVGHIPSALSLPRDEFESGYRALASVLQQHREQVLVVYCSSQDCEDSRMVGEALQRLGYSHIRLFRGGWSDWENGHLPEENSE